MPGDAVTKPLDASPITGWLADWRAGDEGARDRLFAVVHPELRALATPDQFELIAWWDIFGVPATPFAEAIRETYGPGPFRDVVLEF